MEVYVGFTELKRSFWLRSAFIVNKWRFRLDSRDWNEVFWLRGCIFLITNGGSGWLRSAFIVKKWRFRLDLPDSNEVFG